MAYPIYNAPTPEDVDLERKIRMAEMLRQQSDPMEGRMVSGHYVGPSFTQGLANLLRSYSAGRIESDADKAKKDALQKHQEAIGNVIRAGTTPGVQGGFKTGSNQFGNPQDAQSYRAQELERMSMEADLNNPPVQDQPKVQTFGLGMDQVDYQGIGPNGEKVPPAGTMNMLGREQQSNEPIATMPEIGTVAPQMDSMPITEIQGREASFDPKKALFAAMQSGDMQTVNAVLPYLSAYSVMDRDTTKQNDTAEMKNWRYAQNLPEDQRAEFLGRSKSAMPSTVQEWEYFSKLSQPQQTQFLEMKRAAQIMNLGGTMAVRSPGGGIRETYPVTPKPEQAPAFQAAQESAKVTAREQAERAMGAPQAQMKMAGAEDKARNVNSMIDRAINNADTLTTGFVGTISEKVPGTRAHDLGRTLDSIKANLGFAELQSMRDSSPTGGALGQITERELALLQSAWDSVAQSQSKEQFVQNLRNVKRINSEALQRARDMQSRMYGLTPSKQSGPANASGPFKDPDKECRDQEWKRRQK